MPDLKTIVEPAMPSANWRLIADWLEAADIDVAELFGPGWSLRLSRENDYQLESMSSTGACSSHHCTEADPLRTVCAVAQVAGVFLSQHPLRASPQFRMGDTVPAGAVLGFLRIGSLIAPVVSPSHGILVARLHRCGEMVGYGTPLFQIQTEDR